MSDKKIYENSGTLSKNKDLDKPDANPNWPPYKGSARVDGKDYWLSAWVKKGTDGKFFSLSLKPKDSEKASPAAKSQPTTTPPEDDDVPF